MARKKSGPLNFVRLALARRRGGCACVCVFTPSTRPTVGPGVGAVQGWLRHSPRQRLNTSAPLQRRAPGMWCTHVRQACHPAQSLLTQRALTDTPAIYTTAPPPASPWSRVDAERPPERKRSGELVCVAGRQVGSSCARVEQHTHALVHTHPTVQGVQHRTRPTIVPRYAK